MTRILLSNYKYELKRLFKYFKEQDFNNFTKTFGDKIYRWTRGISNPRYAVITENIMIGGQPTEKGLKKLINKNYSLIINLRKEFDYENLVNIEKIRYVYLPTGDDNSISYEYLEKGILEIKSEVENGGKVFIHCLEGLGRSATLLAAYFIMEGCTCKTAIDRIKVKRPFINPSERQIEMLKQFEKKN